MYMKSGNAMADGENTERLGGKKVGVWHKYTLTLWPTFFFSTFKSGVQAQNRSTVHYYLHVNNSSTTSRLNYGCLKECV